MKSFLQKLFAPKPTNNFKHIKMKKYISTKKNIYY